MRRSSLMMCLALAAPVWAQAAGTPPTGAQAEGAAGSPLTAVDVGYGGTYAPYQTGPTPVWLTLAHPETSSEELEVELAVHGGGAAPAELTVSLPPGSRKRVCLVVRVRDDTGLLVEVSVGGETLERRAVTELVALDPSRHMLVLDGRSAGERRGAGSSLLDPVLRYSAISASEAPPEAACYGVFGAVLLLGVDLMALEQDQREALLEHVTNGGTLLTAESGPQRLTAGFFRQTCGPPSKQKLLDRMAETWHVGLGRVLAFPDNVFEAAQGSSSRASRLEQLLGDLVQLSEGGAPFPRVYDELELSAFQGPGGRTRLLVLGFVGCYFLLAGPVLALAFRKASRRRLALAAAGVVLVFCMLAPGVAGVVRVSSGAVYQHSLLFVPLRGPAFELAELTVVSGGATRYELAIAGPRLAATVFPSGQLRERNWSSYGEWGRPQPETQRTHRGEQVSVELSMSPWARQSVSVQALAPQARPLEAELTQGDAGPVLTLVNTTDQPLLDALVMEVGVEPSLWAEYVPVGTLAAGESRTIPIVLQRRGGLTKAWAEYLRVEQQGWTSWRVQPPGWRQLQGRYQLISRVPSGLRLSSAGLEARQTTLRVDELPPWQRRAQGFLGVELEDAPNGARVTRALPGGPAQRAGIAEGDIILFVGSERVRSSAELRRVVAAREPGEDVTLELRDNVGNPRRVSVTLVGRHLAPGQR